MSRESKYDLLAVDLDGTLLDSSHRVADVNRAALHRAHEAGLKIVLCTGRAYTETRPILDQIGLDLDATVTVFGALVSAAQTGETLHSMPMTLDLARSATAWLQEQGHPVLWLSDPHAFGFDGYVIDGARRHPAIDAWVARTPCRVEQVAHVPDNPPPALRLSVIDDADRLSALSARLNQVFDGQMVHNILHVPVYQLSLIEAFAFGVNKWVGIERLCERWKIDPRRTAAVGDDVNDLDMIRCAGLGVAVANARPPVLAAADRTTGSNDEGGVAQLVDELLRD